MPHKRKWIFLRGASSGPTKWDLLNSLLEDDQDYTDALSDRIDELIALRKEKGEAFHMAKKWKLRSRSIVIGERGLSSTGSPS